MTDSSLKPNPMNKQKSLPDLIGISGKIGSGKDTVATIWQCLSMDYTKQATLAVISDNIRFLTAHYKVKRFADKIKDTVCLWLGCTRKQLEDREFKEKPLGKEWVRWRLDESFTPETMDSESNEWYESTKYFSTKKDALEYAKEQEKFLTVPKDERRYGNSAEWVVEDLVKETLTPRKILQLLGTECGRDIIHPNIWINALFADYKPVCENWDSDGNCTVEIYPKWIIPDTRFQNEVEAIKTRGGIVIRVERPTIPASNHPSEMALDAYKGFDHIVYNHGSLEDLFNKVKSIYQTL